MTLCNMTVEAGARAALIAPDQTTSTMSARYCEVRSMTLRGTPRSPTGSDLKSDKDATFDVPNTPSDAHDIAPFVTWGRARSGDASRRTRPTMRPHKPRPKQPPHCVERSIYIGLESNQPDSRNAD